MKKYIDADKLIAEIERLTNQKKIQLKMFNAEDYSCSVASSISCELWGNEEVLSIIKSLQQEQPEVDLEKEIEEHVYSMPHCEFSHYTEDLEDEDWARAEFRYFYELGFNAKKD